MTDSKQNGHGEGWNIQNNYGDVDSVAVGNCHDGEVEVGIRERV